MCYQTRLIKKREEIQDRFQATIHNDIKIEPSEVFKAFDFPKTPVITNKDRNVIQLYNWGLIPEWSTEDGIKKFTLNARIETLNKKPSFKNYIENRCLIIADGFYEWQHQSSSVKIKHLITKPQEALFAMAGLYAQWENYNAEIVHSYTIITTQANELMRTIHNTKHRMPVILKREDEEKWLKGASYQSFGYPYSCELVAKPLNQPMRNDQLGLFD